MKKILLVGTLTKKELRQSKDGSKQFFNLTISENITTPNGQSFTSNTFVTAFQGLFNTVNQIHEGAIVLVEGAPNARAYTNKNGEQAVSIDVTASSISVLEQGNSQPQMQPTMQQTFQTNTIQQPNIQQQLAQFNNQFNNGGFNGNSPF